MTKPSALTALQFSRLQQIHTTRNRSTTTTASCCYTESTDFDYFVAAGLSENQSRQQQTNKLKQQTGSSHLACEQRTKFPRLLATASIDLAWEQQTWSLRSIPAVLLSNGHACRALEHPEYSSESVDTNPRSAKAHDTSTLTCGQLQSMHQVSVFPMSETFNNRYRRHRFDFRTSSKSQVPCQLSASDLMDTSESVVATSKLHHQPGSK